MKKISKSLSTVASKISLRDAQALKSIYDLRCLTSSQIYQLHYSFNIRTNKPVADTFCKTKISTFLELGLIEKVSFILNNQTHFCFFLTSLGIDLVRVHFNLPHNIFDSSRKVVSRGYLRPSELKINPRLIPHQIYLNQFYIDFTKLGYNLNYTYKDSKHATSFFDVAPDAILTTQNTHFFIETDLGTESKKLLIEKWRHYRSFLNSEESSYLERKIVVLFIIENLEDIQQRRDLVKLTAYEELVDLLGDHFDIYVGSRSYILECLNNKLLPPSLEQSNLSISKLTDILASNHNIESKPAELAASKLIEAKNFTYLSKSNDNIQHNLFFITDYFFEPLSFFNKIAYFERTKDLFYNSVNRTINLIVIVNSIDNLYNDLSLTSLANLNIFYSTIERLENLPLEEALFQLDLSGNLYTFNKSLSERVFSYNILNEHS